MPAGVIFMVGSAPVIGQTSIGSPLAQTTRAKTLPMRSSWICFQRQNCGAVRMGFGATDEQPVDGMVVALHAIAPDALADLERQRREGTGPDLQTAEHRD